LNQMELAKNGLGLVHEVDLERGAEVVVEIPEDKLPNKNERA